jgi:hypothetical protein
MDTNSQLYTEKHASTFVSSIVILTHPSHSRKQWKTNGTETDTKQLELSSLIVTLNWHLPFHD